MAGTPAKMCDGAVHALQIDSPGFTVLICGPAVMVRREGGRALVKPSQWLPPSAYPGTVNVPPLETVQAPDQTVNLDKEALGCDHTYMRAFSIFSAMD